MSSRLSPPPVFEVLKVSIAASETQQGASMSAAAAAAAMAAMAGGASPLAFSKPKVLLIQSRRHLVRRSFLLLAESPPRQHPISCSIKASPGEHFGAASKVAGHLKNLAGTLSDVSPEPLKAFPWKKARSIFVERLLFLGQKAAKWSFIVLFVIGFVSDIFLAVSTNKELIIPVGVFVGVTLADLLRESSQEYFQNSIKDRDFIGNLLTIGSIFAFLKLISLSFKIQGWLLLCHICNGGLMQVLWLAKEYHQQAEGIKGQEG